MGDPFSELASAEPEFIEQVVATLELRASDPTMISAVDRYLDAVISTGRGLSLRSGPALVPSVDKSGGGSRRPRS